MPPESTEVMDAEEVSQLLHHSPEETLARPPNPELASEPIIPLPRLALSDTADSPAELRFEGTLGSGGMADVHLAVQSALDRTVAVKVLKPSGGGAGAAQALIKEGRITGSLEHPNIVPVHTLGQDDEGRPMLVMKRIEGVAWHELVAMPAHRAPDWVPADRLQWNVEVLMQVCRAISFAHSHGVLHRDIKPANIMLGSFGEVYVLDWGIAIDKKIESDNRATKKRVVGSPAYMAPEMLTGRMSDLTTLTDVYLLGATLHRVITGVPRHNGETPQDLWRAIKASRPFVYDGAIPDELAEICNTATRKEPGRRYQSAEALRLALADFLKHRASVDLSDEASRRLRQLKISLVAGQAQNEPVSEDYTLRTLGACRFGFMQALTIWEFNRAAIEGLRDTLRLAVEHELDRGAVSAAARLLEEMDEPDPTLEERLEQLMAQQTQNRDRLKSLQAFEQDLDVDVGAKRRSLFTAGVGLVSFLGPLLIALSQNLGWIPVSHTVSIVSATLMIFFVAALVWGFRHWLFRNKANQRLTYAASIAVVGFWLHRIRAALLGLSAHQAIAGDTFLFALVAALAAATVDKRIVWAVPVYLAASFSAAMHPHLSQELSAVANLMGIGLIALSWWRQPRIGDQTEADD